MQRVLFLVLLTDNAGDFNARVGKGVDKWACVIGLHRVGNWNWNGELMALCSEHNLFITNTIFKRNEHHKKDMDKTLAGLQHQESEIVEENWSSLEVTIYNSALSVLGKSNCKHQVWFNDTDKKLLEERNTARVKKLQVNTRSNRTKLTGTRRSLKQYTREMKSQRWEAKEAEKKDMKELLKWSDRSTWDIEEGYNTVYCPWWWDSNTGESWDSRQIYKLLWEAT